MERRKKMRDQRKFYKGRLILAFLLTNLLFILIFLFSYSVSYINYQEISKENNLIRQNIEELSSYITKSNCDNTLLSESSERLDAVGSRMSLLETRFGKNDLRVIKQKALYSELEYKHFEIVKRLKLKCDKNFTIILFFYSNNKPFDEESEKIGFILGTFKNKNPEKNMIYSFDYDIDNRVINKLKRQYNIESAPIVLVNEIDLINVKNINDLDKYM